MGLLSGGDGLFCTGNAGAGGDRVLVGAGDLHGDATVKLAHILDHPCDLQLGLVELIRLGCHVGGRPAQFDPQTPARVEALARGNEALIGPRVSRVAGQRKRRVAGHVGRVDGVSVGLKQLNQGALLGPLTGAALDQQRQVRRGRRQHFG